MLRTFSCARLVKFFHPYHANGAPKFGQRAGARGQIIVEYVLLLVVAVVIAATITRFLVRRSEDERGVVITAWQRILETIGNDTADEPK